MTTVRQKPLIDGHLRKRQTDQDGKQEGNQAHRRVMSAGTGALAVIDPATRSDIDGNFGSMRAGLGFLFVTRIDRLARSLKDLQDIVHELKAKGVALKATEQPVDTGTAAGKAFLDMLGVFAEFETNLRRERQLEGISAAKARGVYKGRKPSIDDAEVIRLRREEKLGPAAIARRLGIGRASVYRLLGKHNSTVSANGGGNADQA